uniref:chromate transporter n=1 Tax=Candidatus Entotheonella palauensis TaxID=93172 RepID=UPI001178BF89
MNTAANTTNSHVEVATIHPLSLSKLFRIFLKIGCVSFGGFMALISVIADTIVEKHKLLTNDDMLD